MKWNIKEIQDAASKIELSNEIVLRLLANLPKQEKEKRTFTYEQYVKMSARFNKMKFKEKIETIQNNTDILCLGNDNGWWVVKVKDSEIQEKLEDSEKIFTIENQWVHRECEHLISILGIEITDV